MAMESEERLPTDWTAKFKVETNGRKTKYYINVRTGQKFFSKEDLLRYVEMKGTQLDEENSSSKAVAKENKQENSHSGSENRSTELVAKENNRENSCGNSHSENSIMKPVAEEYNHENGRGKRQAENSSTKPVVEENNRPHWLPDGWVVDLKTRQSGSAVGRQYKVYIDPITGCKFFSMPEVLRHLECMKNRNSECERKTTPAETLKYEAVRKVSTKTEGETTEAERETTERDSETSKYGDAQKISTKAERETTERVMVEKSTVVDLPPGWIKETKVRKTARGIRKDPYYIDPVSGYVFCSKKDVFRYLETGEISKYAYKPRKKGTDVPELVTEEVLQSPYAKSQKLDHTVTRRRLFSVKESSSSDVCSPAVMKAEVLNKRQGKEVSGLAGAPTAEIPPEPMAKMVIDKGAETKEISSLSGSALPKLRRSKRNQGKMGFADDGPVSTPVIDSLQEQRLLESHIECSNGKTLNDMTKSSKKKKLNFPLRSSKRLAGLEPELVSNCLSIEQAPKNVTTESRKNVAISSAVLTSTGLENKVSQHLKAGSVPELANHVSSDVTIPSSGEPSSKFKSSGRRTTPGEQLQKFKSAETSDHMSGQCVSLFFGNSYLDPCLEPAFKALIGELPVNSNPDNGPVLNPAADTLQETSMQTTVEEKRSSRKTHINSMQSKNKHELSLACRSSKRLAGLGPEMMANCESLERAPKNITTESCKSKGILASGLTSSSLVDEVSQQLKAGPVLGLPNRASAVLGLAKCVSSSGKPLSEIKSSGNLSIIGRQSVEANDDKSEPHLPLSFGGSILNPCKTLGETLVDSFPDNEPVSTTANILPGKKLQETKVGKSNNKKTLFNSKKSKNKQQLNLPRRSSKRLAGLEPVLVSNSISVEQARGNATVESCKSETPACEKADPHGPPDGASQQVEAGHETMLTQHDPTDIVTPLLEESDRNSKPLEAQTVSEEPSQKLENEKPEEQPQKLEGERTDLENPDSQILLPYGDSWSDPCLEFAFKTLTGAIPVDENLAIQDYFQHQLDPSNTQKDDSLALPDFGPVKSFQTDVSHQPDTPEHQPAPAPAPHQQLPANPLPPPGNASMPSCGSIDLNNLA